MKKKLLYAAFLSIGLVNALSEVEILEPTQKSIIVKNSNFLDDEVTFNPKQIRYFKVLNQIRRDSKSNELQVDTISLPLMRYLQTVFEEVMNNSNEVNAQVLRDYLQDDQRLIKDNNLDIPLSQQNTLDLTLENVLITAHILNNPILYQAAAELVAQKIKNWSTPDKLEMLRQYIDMYDIDDISFTIRNLLLNSNHVNEEIIKSSNKVDVFTQHKGAVYSVACNPINNLVASGSYDQTIKIWDMQTRKVVHNYGNYGSVYAVAWHPGGALLAAAQQKDAIIRLINYQTNLNKPFSFHDNAAYNLAWNHAGTTLALNYSDSFGMWDFNKQTKNVHITPVSSIRGISWNSNDSRIALAGPRNKIALYNPKRVLENTFSAHTKKVNAVSYDPKGVYLVSGGDDNLVILWNNEGKHRTLKKQPLLQTSHDAPVTAVCWNHDGTYFATADAQGTILIWDRYAKFIKEFNGHSDKVTSLCWNIEGSVLISGSLDKTVRIWQFANDIIKKHAKLWDALCLVKIVEGLRNDEKYCADNPYFEEMSDEIKNFLIKNKILLNSSKDKACIVS